MATLGLGSTHQQLLQTSSRTMSGFFCERMQQRAGCSSTYGMQTVSHGVHVTSMTQPTRSGTGIFGMGTRRVAMRRTALALPSPSTRCLAGGVTREKNFVSMTIAAWFKDRADILEWKREEESSVLNGAAVNECRFEFENLIHGHVGRFAFLAILLMGVGVGCLSNAGDAEAATNHINSNGGLYVDMKALAMGPEGPLLEEFWDNMRRYGLYFLTVVTGGVYQLVKPFVDALKNPLTAILVVVVVTGSIYLVGLTVSAMLGINEYNYEYAQ